MAFVVETLPVSIFPFKDNETDFDDAQQAAMMEFGVDEQASIMKKKKIKVAFFSAKPQTTP